MKRRTKQVLGLSGLVGVFAMTAFAATIPAPGASATTNSVTDTIQVRVVGTESDVTVKSNSPEQITEPSYSFTTSYDNIATMKAVVVRKDANGNVVNNTTIWDENVDYVSGTKDFNLNLNDYGGAGYYTVTVTGVGYNGVPIERILSFVYTNVDADVETDEDGNVGVDVNPPATKTEQVIINIYDENGNLVRSETIDDPGDKVEADLSGLPDGDYKVEIIHKDSNGNVTKTTETTVVKNDNGGNEDVTIPLEDQGQDVSKAVITVVDKDTGEVVKTIEVDNPGDSVDVDFGDLPAGNYDVNVDYYDENGNKIGSSTTPVSKTDSEGKVDLDVDTSVDTVDKIEIIVRDKDGDVVRIIEVDRNTGNVIVRDANGNIIKEIPNGYVNGKLNIPMDGLDSGDYNIEVIYRDKNGNIVGVPYSTNVDYTAKEVPVPNTGAFFQNLNISKQDYLVTGLIIFFVFGVVAFGVVMRGRKAKASHKKKR